MVLIILVTSIFYALGEFTGLFDGFHLKLTHGLVKMLPIFVVANVVGLAIEFFYAAKKGHPIEEGYIVTGALIPLIMPPDLPLWILAMSIVFAVILGKEAFGGTGMNIWNIALLARVFVFFAYPTTISGDDVWISGIAKEGITYSTEYTMVHGWLDNLFSSFGWSRLWRRRSRHRWFLWCNTIITCSKRWLGSCYFSVHSISDVVGNLSQDQLVRLVSRLSSSELYS